MNEQPTQPVYVAAAQPIWKDLLVPASIVVAGVAIGIGLYMSGGSTVTPLAGQPTAVPQEVDRTDQIAAVTPDDHRKGPADAAITIVEYSDFDCVFCGRFHDTMNQVIATTDDVAWVYRHSPIAQIHPQAEFVAIASECVANIAGTAAFWTFTDGYFAARAAGESASHAALVPQLAAAAGVGAAALEACVAGGEFTAAVEADRQNAIATGGGGTPWSILIGPSGKTYPINGALPLAAIEQLIQIARDEA
jgi:protein-disulfide isomerase